MRGARPGKATEVLTIKVRKGVSGHEEHNAQGNAERFRGVPTVAVQGRTVLMTGSVQTGGRKSYEYRAT